MIYNLIFLGGIKSFARVKIKGQIEAGHNIKLKGELYKVNYLELLDIYVSQL